jgi:hypothetical protein
MYRTGTTVQDSAESLGARERVHLSGHDVGKASKALRMPKGVPTSDRRRKELDSRRLLTGGYQANRLTIVNLAFSNLFAFRPPFEQDGRQHCRR